MIGANCGSILLVWQWPIINILWDLHVYQRRPCCAGHRWGERCGGSLRLLHKDHVEGDECALADEIDRIMGLKIWVASCNPVPAQMLSARVALQQMWGYDLLKSCTICGTWLGFLNSRKVKSLLLVGCHLKCQRWECAEDIGCHYYLMFQHKPMLMCTHPHIREWGPTVRSLVSVRILGSLANINSDITQALVLLPHGYFSLSYLSLGFRDKDLVFRYCTYICIPRRVCWRANCKIHSFVVLVACPNPTPS